ncbi:hypothetical protein [Parabacteroides merdae]|uniref:hypothetical protein n=2 Tax=Parabacteroides merdae TaxID=46503 RepID=UPI00321929A4
MADRGITYDILLRMRDQVSGVSKTIDKELKVVKQSADQVVGSLNGISGRLSAVSNSSVGNVKNISNVVDNLKRQYQSLGKEAATASEALENSTKRVTPRFNSLNVSVQQVARELPALAISANTFFLAISNNLPILADSISAVRKENQELIASGQKAVPVWKQVAGSIFSWQTALVAGVTILSMYGEEIFDFTKSLFVLSDATDSNKKAFEALRNTAISYNEELFKESNNLRYIYNEIMATTEGTAARKNAIDRLNDTYEKYMPYLLSEKSSLGELNTVYTAINSNLRTQIALKARSSQIDELLNEASKSQAEAVYNMQKALSNQKLSTPISDQIIASLVQDAPKWREAGDTLGEAFQQAMKNIQTTFPQVKFDSDTRSGIYDYLKSFYQMESAIDAVNKRVDLLLGKTNQITEIGEVIITPDKNGNNEDLNTNLKTIGGIENKIKNLKEIQSKASEEQQVALEKEIRLYEARLELMKKTIFAAAEGNLTKGDKELLKLPNIQAMDVPAIEFPLKIDEKSYQRVQQKIRESGYVFVKEAQITARQMSGILSNSIQGFMEGFGEAVASGNGLEILRSFLLSLMDMLQQFGSALIAAGMASEAIKAIAWSGIGGIIAGSALIAATAAAKAALQNITAFAAGGIVSGPTLALVGEYSGASNNPEVIAPLNKLRSMLEPTGLSAKSLYLETKVKGKDLYIALRGVEHEKRRTR